MPERGSTARPGVAPTSRRTAGTLFAALCGALTPHPWHDPEHDAYQLFHQRSLAMGLLDDDAETGSGDTRPAPGLWGMNDAGRDHPLAAPGSGLISWFQVEAGAVPADRPLPVRPFLRCAGDVTARIGAVRLSSVQILLPVQGLDPAARPPYAPVPSMQTVDWFAAGDPRDRTAVEVSVSAGRDPVLPGVVRQFTDDLRRLDQDVFVHGSHEVVGRDGILPPPFDDTFWNGPPLHGLVLRGELAEWSYDAIGWLAETVADCAARLGVRSPLLFSVARALPTD